MTGSTAERRRNWRLILSVTPRFWPDGRQADRLGRLIHATDDFN